MDSRSVAKEHKSFHFIHDLSQSGRSQNRSVERMIPLDDVQKSQSDLFSVRMKQRRGSEELQGPQRSQQQERQLIPNHILFTWMNNPFIDPSVRSHAMRNQFSVIDQRMVSRNSLEPDNTCEDIPTVEPRRNHSSTIVAPQIISPEVAAGEEEKDADTISELNSMGSRQNQKKGDKRKLQIKPTKNLLRDFAKNFHEYVLHTSRASAHLERLFTKKPPVQHPNLSFQRVKILFKKEIEHLRDQHLMETFVNYRKKWQGTTTFDFYYRYLTLRFYIEESPCYFFKSKVKRKDVYLDYLHNFVTGIRMPSKFDRFRTLARRT